MYVAHRLKFELFAKLECFNFVLSTGKRPNTEGGSH